MFLQYFSLNALLRLAQQFSESARRIHRVLLLTGVIVLAPLNPMARLYISPGSSQDAVLLCFRLFGLFFLHCAKLYTRLNAAASIQAVVSVQRAQPVWTPLRCYCRRNGSLAAVRPLMAGEQLNITTGCNRRSRCPVGRRVVALPQFLMFHKVNQQETAPLLPRQ